MLIKDLDELSQLSQKEENVLWNLVDDQYKNTELWDLLRISGVDEMSVEDIKQMAKDLSRFSKKGGEQKWETGLVYNL